ncbi:MAG: AAA family ATPase, partial [Chloroflexi bacterium]|nr:AAA family ATPase [Chloroflexota bacterium]
MISGDDYLAMTTGENLRTIESEFRSADSAHIASGAQRLNHALAVQWKSAVEAHPEAAAHLRSLLREAEPTVADMESVAADLTQPLVPVWVSSPLGLAAHFPPAGTEPSFDTVVLLDAETLSVPAALGAICRARQVVAFGDPASGAPKPMIVSADPIAREAESQVPDSSYAELARILPEHSLRHVHRGVDQELTQLLSEKLYDGRLVRLPDASQLTGQDERLRMEQVQATGAREPVESPTAEVNRVVDLVFEHVRAHRNRSLAVVTGSEWHAKRVADAIRLHLANHPWAAPFFEHGAAGVPGGSGA